MSTLSYSRWIFLLSLSALMFISASEGSAFQALPCWEMCIFPRKQHLQSCYEQKPRRDCQTHGFVVENQRGQRLCIKGHAQWVKNMIEEGHLVCPPDISHST